MNTLSYDDPPINVTEEYVINRRSQSAMDHNLDTESLLPPAADIKTEAKDFPYTLSLSQDDPPIRTLSPGKSVINTL